MIGRFQSLWSTYTEGARFLIQSMALIIISVVAIT